MGFTIFRWVSCPSYVRILVLTFAALAQVFPGALRALQPEASQRQFQTQDDYPEPSPEAHLRGAMLQTEYSDEMRSLVVTVGSVQGFAHEKRCAGELCDGFVVSAHDDSISYVLICASHYYGESDSDKQYNDSSRAKNCRAVRPERWAAKTDDRDFLYYSGPNMLFAEYEVSSEGKRSVFKILIRHADSSGTNGRGLPGVPDIESIVLAPQAVAPVPPHERVFRSHAVFAKGHSLDAPVYLLIRTGAH